MWIFKSQFKFIKFILNDTVYILYIFQIMVYKNIDCLACLLNCVWPGKVVFCSSPIFLVAAKNCYLFVSFICQSSNSAYSSLIRWAWDFLSSHMLCICWVHRDIDFSIWRDLRDLWIDFLMGQKDTIFTSSQNKSLGGLESKCVGFKTCWE